MEPDNKIRGKILVVDDEASLRLLLSKELGREGFSVDVASSGEEALRLVSEDSYQVVLLDIVMPGMNGIDVLRKFREENVNASVIILTGNASIESAIDCMKLGAFEYVRKPYSLNELLIQVDRALEHQQAMVDRRILREELVRSGHGGKLIGSGRRMQDLRKMIDRIAQTQATVLIQGESGTGKELVARSIHDSSLRADKHFVAINCASLSEALLESELFGYEKGAFTDAKTQKRGLAEVADGGTLFLDEIGEIPLHFQAKLLRFLETSEIRRVGGTRDIRLNVRIICATNKPLEDLMQRNEFRSDLYYRLNVLAITVPPLRLHPEDIPVMVEHFMNILGQQKTFHNLSLELLQRYPWPGNVRELKNVVERTCILCPESVVTTADLSFLSVRPLPVADTVVTADGQNVVTDMPVMSLKEMERRLIIAVLRHVQGHKGNAAEILQVNPKTLYHKMRAYNIVSTYE